MVSQDEINNSQIELLQGSVSDTSRCTSGVCQCNEGKREAKTGSKVTKDTTEKGNFSSANFCQTCHCWK